MKNHIFLIAISIALLSCNKVKNQYTSVNGVVKLGLNDSLMANVPIDLWESYGSAFNNGSKVIASTTSDENGNFSFSSFITKPNQDYYVHVNDDAYLVMSDSKNNDIINLVALNKGVLNSVTIKPGIFGYLSSEINGSGVNDSIQLRLYNINSNVSTIKYYSNFHGDVVSSYGYNNMYVGSYIFDYIKYNAGIGTQFYDTVKIVKGVHYQHTIIF